MARRARENIAAAGLSARVEVKIGDAQALMAALNGPFDLIFMDIDKEGYLPALAGCHRLLRLGGLLVVDNTGFQGAADFNQALLADRRWRSVNLLTMLPQHSPEKDGLALAVKIAIIRLIKFAPAYCPEPCLFKANNFLKNLPGAPGG